MATLLFILTLTVFLAAVGRDAIPPAERLPVQAWTWRDLIANIARGARRPPELNQRQRRLWNLYLDEPQPHHRRTHLPRSTPGDRRKGNLLRDAS